MRRSSVVEILKGKFEVGSEVTVEAWVRTRRDSKAELSFIHVYDGSCLTLLQVIAPATLANYTEEVAKLTTGCAIRARGILQESQGKGQSVEVVASEIEVIGWVDDPQTYPMSAKRHTMEHLREYTHLRPRTNTIAAVMRVRNSLSQAIHRYFHQNGFFWLHTPIVTSSDCEGAGEMFRVTSLNMENPPRRPDGKIDYEKDFFGKSTFLTVSGQLCAEAYALGMSKVYTFGPTFRAENSNTTRHLAEFWMVEPEVAFADLRDNAALAESFLKSIFSAVLDECAEDMELFDKFIDKGCIARVRDFIDKSFEIMEYGDAIAALEKSKKKFEFPVHWGADLQSEHERYLTETVVKRPVVIVNYPKQIKAFYMRLNDDDKTVAAMDVLAPGIGEIIGGSQREERLDVLDRMIAEKELPIEEYGWYRDLRRYGSVPHAGFGLGLERAIIYLTGVGNIRDVIPFPRTPGHADH